jgi:hypothetical protein
MPSFGGGLALYWITGGSVAGKGSIADMKAALLVLAVCCVVSSPVHAADTKTPAQKLAGASAKEKPAAAKRLVQDEIEQIQKQREGLPTEAKPVDLSALSADEDFAKALAALGSDPKKATIAQIRAAADRLEAENDEQGLYLLAGALKLAAKQEANPEMSAAQIAQSMLVESLQNFAPGSDAKVHFPASLESKILSALQTPSTSLTGWALQKFFQDSASAAMLTPEEKVKIAAAGNLAAARDLGDSYMRQAAQESGKQIERANPGARPPQAARGIAPGGRSGNASVCPAPGQHQNAAQREQPDLGAGGSIAGGALPSVPDAAGGRAFLNPSQASALSAQPVEFDGPEGEALTKAVQKRKSLTMEIGRQFRHPFSGRNSFSAQSLCQATVVHPPELPPFQKIGDSCRYVLASAKHCFGELTLQDVISLNGFAQPIDAAHRKVIVSGGQGEDFATLLVDVPCDSVAKDLPSEPLAPPAMLRAGGQAVVLDVQRTGERAVAGRTAPTRDRSFVGVNVLGQGRIFPGDSGGRMAVVDPSGQTYFAGVTSSKFVDASFQDAVGNVAVVPLWLREGFRSGEYLQPLPTEQLAKHVAPDDALLAATLTHR